MKCVLENKQANNKKGKSSAEQLYIKVIKLLGCWLENFSYEERLRQPGLISLEKRRPRGELTVTFQYMWGM